MTRSMYSTWKIVLLERLRRAVVDLLGEARALGLLGLDDAHLVVARGRRSADLGQQGRVAAFEEEPRPLERPLGELQPGELGLTVADVSGECLDVAAQRASSGIVGAGLGRVGRPVHGCGAGLPRVPSACARSSASSASRRTCHSPRPSEYASRYRSRTLRSVFAL